MRRMLSIPTPQLHISRLKRFLSHPTTSTRFHHRGARGTTGK
jgi:hypothetical protein